MVVSISAEARLRYTEGAQLGMERKHALSAFMGWRRLSPVASAEHIHYFLHDGGFHREAHPTWAARQK